MGLDVRVYKNIQQTDDEDQSDFEAYVIDDDWKHKIKNLKDGGLYKGDVIDNSISYSCSSHNRFRETLIKLIGRNYLLKSNGTIDWENLSPKIPFYDFIDFADNEGCIDWETSERIYKDFKAWENEAKKFYDKHQFSRYRQWLNVFDLARDNGVVVFT